MVDLVLDPHGLEPTSDATVLELAKDYVQRRLELREAIQSGRPYRLIIRHPGMWDWFEDCLIDRENVKARKRNAVAELRQALHGSAIPQWLEREPRLIVSWNLIALAPHRQPQQTVEAWLCGTLVGPIWGQQSLSLELAPALLKSILELDWHKLHTRVRDLMTSRLAMWAEASPLSPFLSWLSGNIPRHALVFDLAQRLSGYPFERMTTWLNSYGFADLARLQNWQQWARNLPLSAVQDSHVPSDINAAVRRYLVETVMAAPEQFCEMVRQTSGRIPGEVAALRTIFGRWVSPVSADIVTLLEERFPDQEFATIASEYVEPTVPARFPIDGESSAVLHWVHAYYLPYYRWSRAVEMPTLTEEHVVAFQDWYYQHSPEMRSLSGTTYGLVDHLLTLANPSALLVLVDGLGAEWVPDVLRLLAQRGLRPLQPPHWRFTILPSITELAKPALIRGQRPSQITELAPGTVGYRRLFGERLSGKTVYAISDSDRGQELEDLVVSGGPQERYFLFLVNELDEIMHQPATERMRRKRIAECLSNICHHVQQACEHYHQSFGRHLPVLISSDHGHTTLTDKSRPLEVPEGGDVSHGRVVRLASNPPFIPPGTRLLPAERWGLPHSYLTALGYDYFGNRPSGGVHGGMLPEEVVVPVVCVQLGVTQSTELISPYFSLVSGRVMRNRPTNTVVLRIENPNPDPIMVFGLKMEQASGIPASISIDGHQTTELEITIDARGLKAGNVQLTFRYNLRCGEHELPNRLGSVAVNVRAAMANQSDDFFL